MAIQMTAKERLLAKAAANKAEQDRLRASMPAADHGYMDRLQEEEKQRQAIANAERVRAQRSRTVEMPPVPKTPVSDRAKKVAEIRAGIDTTPIQSRAGKAGQSIGLNTMASVQYLGETVGQIGENTRDWLGTDEAEEYAAAVSEFNRIRKYALEDSPEYIAAEQRMLQARQKAEAKSAEEQSETVDPDSLGSRMMGESMRLKEEALEGTEGVGRFLAETGMSVASNVAKLPLGALAPVAMGAEAAAGKAYELQQQGVGAGQAMTRGITSGVIEGITEKMGLDNLFDLVKTGGKTAVKNVLKQAGVEGTEEGFSYVFNLLADKAAKDPNAQFNWYELLQSIASGAISGLFFGAAGTAVNRGQALPDVIEQTGKEKQAPRDGSLHLASEKVVGLPMVDQRNNTEPQPLPVREVKTPNRTAPAAETRKADILVAGRRGNPGGDYWELNSERIELNGGEGKNGEPAYIMNMWYKNAKDPTDKANLPKGTTGQGVAQAAVERFMEHVQSTGRDEFVAMDLSEDAQGFFDHLVEKGVLEDRGKQTFSYSPKDPQRVFGIPKAAEPQPLSSVENKKTAGQSQAGEKPPYDLVKVDKGYLAAVNDKIVSFIQEVKNKTAWKGKKIVTGTVNDRLGADIKSLTGVDLSGKEHRINTNAVEHILRRHGENGQADQSMKDPKDIARVQWVLDNYDGIRKGDQSGGYKNSDGSPATPIEVYKKIDGTYYVVEAVVDAQSGYLGMVSAYINKKDASTGVQDRTNRGSGDTGAGAASFTEAYQVPDADAPSHTSETALELTPNSSIRESGAGVKPDPVELPSVDTGKSGEGLPMKRREEIQDALTAGLNGGRTLGDKEARTGLPLPTEVESQLQALEALTTPMEDGDDVANTIRKYMGEEAALYWLEHKNDDAEGAEDGDLFSRPAPDNSGAVTDEAGDVVGTRATEKLGVRIEGGIADMSAVQAARQAQWGLDVAQKQIQKAEKELHASAAEKRMAESIAKGQDTLDSFKYGWDGKDNRRRSVVEELSALYRMRDLYDRKGIKALGRKNKDVFIDKLNAEILNHVQDATPPKAASLHTNTWSRNNLRTWGRELGEKVNQLIFDPIRRNEANRIRWLDSQATDMKILGELTDAENEAVFDMLDNGKEVATYDGVRNDVVQEAADKLKTKYAQYYDAINDVLVAHGYPEIGFIKNYAPHKQPEQMKSAMSIFEKLGLSDTVTELPTELAGRTDIFKPGKKWNPHFLHRTGDKAALDAVGGYMSYLNYMSEVLFHVDDIQKVRTFGDQIRYLYGDEGLQADYDAIRADKSLNEQEKELELARIRERQTDNSKMGAYVTALDNYANILAGKQTQLDRAVETAIGRRGLNWLQKPVQVLVQSSIPGNISSAINQTVQLPWLTAEAGESNVLQAAWELSRGKLKREGFAGESDFLTGKRGAENYNALKDKTTGEKILDKASIPFEAVDDASSQIIVRAFYLKNVKAGMEHEAALRQADKQAERLVGSRMKGQKANVFSDKSLKLLTTFQLEVANQWQHLKFDLPQEYREIERTRGAGAAKAEAVKRIVKGTVYTFALNSLIEQITGSKPAGYDIIGAIWDYIKAGLPGEDEEEEGFDFEAGLSDLGAGLTDDVPFVGTISTLLGYGDGRLPLPEPDLQNLKSGWSKIRAAETDEEKAAGVRQLLTGVLKTGSAFAPMGNQIRKTIEGGETAIRGGRYTNDGTQLMYEVESSPQNIARGLVFGRNALPETREYWDKGGKAVLSQKQTGLMEKAGEYGVDQGTFVDFIQQAKKLAADKDAEGKTIDGSLERKKISLLDGMDLSGEQKLQLYLDNVASDSRKEDVEAMTAAGMNWDQMAPAIDTYLSMEAEDLGATQKATQLASWADQNLNGQQAAVVKERLEYWQMMRAEASSYEKLTGAGLSSESAQRVYDIYQSLEPEAGKTTVTETQKQKAVANSRDLSEGDKRMAVRSMLDGTALEKFDTCVRAGVNTADYVRVKEFNSNTYADKDKNGKSISGSKKEKVWKYINGLAVSESGKDALSVLCGYDTKLNEAPWHNGIVGLPMLEQAGNAEQFTMPVLELPSRERSGWEMPALMLP